MTYQQFRGLMIDYILPGLMFIVVVGLILIAAIYGYAAFMDWAYR